MKNAVTIFALSLLATVIALHAADQTQLPSECDDVNFSTTGRPVMFPYRAGISLGLSAVSKSFAAGGPMSLSIWVVNHTDEEKSLMTCADVEWWTLDLDVYDSHWQRVQTLLERERQQHPQRTPKQYAKGGHSCYRNFPVTIAPHTCSPFNDTVRFVTTDLATRYRLTPGEYFVTPKKLILPIHGLQISVVDSGGTQNPSPNE